MVEKEVKAIEGIQITIEREALAQRLASPSKHFQGSGSGQIGILAHPQYVEVSARRTIEQVIWRKDHVSL
jgi:hypothetical protein